MQSTGRGTLFTIIYLAQLLFRHSPRRSEDIKVKTCLSTAVAPPSVFHPAPRATRCVFFREITRYAIGMYVWCALQRQNLQSLVCIITNYYLAVRGCAKRGRLEVSQTQWMKTSWRRRERDIYIYIWIGEENREESVRNATRRVPRRGWIKGVIFAGTQAVIINETDGTLWLQLVALPRLPRLRLPRREATLAQPRLVSQRLTREEGRVYKDSFFISRVRRNNVPPCFLSIVLA